MEISYDGMHGTRNSFVLVSDLDDSIENQIALDKLAVELCSREKVDGAIYLKKSDGRDFRMRIFNPDGSEAEMCGNGIRCLAIYARDHGLTTSDMLAIETLAGTIGARIVGDKVRVNMGCPQIVNEQQKVAGKFAGTVASVGNPHFVMFYDSPVTEDFVRKVGPVIENSEEFLPAKTNVEFASITQVEDGLANIDLKVWERGAGFTQACGTGAVATAYVAHKLKGASSKSLILLPGGFLQVELAEVAYLIGPADYLFKNKKLNLSEALA